MSDHWTELAKSLGIPVPEHSEDEQEKGSKEEKSGSTEHSERSASVDDTSQNATVGPSAEAQPPSVTPSLTGTATSGANAQAPGSGTPSGPSTTSTTTIGKLKKKVKPRRRVSSRSTWDMLTSILGIAPQDVAQEGSTVIARSPDGTATKPEAPESATPSEAETTASEPASGRNEVVQPAASQAGDALAPDPTVDSTASREVTLEMEYEEETILIETDVDEEPTSDQTFVAGPAEQEEEQSSRGRRRGRRRRRRRRELEDEQLHHESDAIPTEAEATEDELEADDEETIEPVEGESSRDAEISVRGRRRRRRRRQERKELESAEGEDTELTTPRVPADSRSSTADAQWDEESELSNAELASDDEVDQEAGSEASPRAIKHKNIPSWEQAIEPLIAANMANHRKSENRGGRGRNRGRRN